MSQDKLNYEFAETGGGIEVGFNEPMMTNFKGSYAQLSQGAILAREAIQNAIDARDNDNSPVRVEFELTKIKSNELPQYDDFLRTFKDCRDSSRNYYKDDSAADFFQSAVDKLESSNPISILRVGDYNTMGVTGGDDEPTGNYYNLLKTLGASSKGDDSGGSYGLGKGTYYANSYFRTIFVSSICGEGEWLFQGKLILMTHKKHNIKHQHIGSFGLSGQNPVREERLVPSIFRHESRKERGTDFYIVGFDRENWKTEIMNSVLNNFWLAILEGKLEVKVGEQSVTRDNIEHLIKSQFDESELTQDNPLPHFLAYTDEQRRKVFQEDIPVLGSVSLYIRLGEEFYNYKQVSEFRNTGMEIRRKRRSASFGFAGVFVCNSVEGNKILRMMENPHHNEWDPERAERKNPESLEVAKKAIKALNSFRRRSLRSIAFSTESESLDMQGIEEYFPGEEKGKCRSEAETSQEFGAVSEDSSVGTVRKVRVYKPSPTPSPTPGPGPKIISLRTRSFAVVGKNREIKHIVNVRGVPGTECDLKVEAGTDDSLSPLDIVAVEYVNGPTLLSDKNRILNLKLGNDGRARVAVSFGTNDRYALKITATE